MEKEFPLSEDLAYWIGVVQTDGYFKKRKYKKRKGYTGFFIKVRVSSKSLPMLRKFKQLSKKLFARDAIIYKDKNRDEFECTIGVKKLLDIFQNLDIDFSDPPTPCEWMKNPEFFGPYLAGVIDGDGNVRIKRPKYPQCVIRIGSGSEQTELAESIREILNCSVSITPQERDSVLNERKIHGRWFDLEFYVSSKNFKFIQRCVLPHMTIHHKIEKLKLYFKKRGWQRPGFPARKQYTPDH